MLALGHSDRLTGTKDERHRRASDDAMERGTWPSRLNRTAGGTQQGWMVSGKEHRCVRGSSR